MSDRPICDFEEWWRKIGQYYSYAEYTKRDLAARAWEASREQFKITDDR